MRYSELTGKEVIDLSEGVRLGAVTSSDLVIDTEQGTVRAMIIYQRTGFFATQELTLDWVSVCKIGRDLIVVDMSTVAQDAALPAPKWVKQPTANVINRVVRHRVAGIEHEMEKPTVEPYAVEAQPENEAPEVALGWLAREAEHGSRSLWRRGRRMRSR